jgi:hypothetical protein
MKNKLLLFIALLVSLFITSTQNIVKANDTLNYGLHPVKTGEYYNYFIFANNQEDLNKTNYVAYYDECLDSLYYDETVQYRFRLTSYITEYEYELLCSYVYDEGILKEISYEIENHIYYKAKFQNKELIEVIYSEDLFVENLTGKKGDRLHVGDFVIEYGDEITIEAVDKLNIACALANNYKENTVYESKDVYFISDINNPVSLETLKTYISANDPTDGDVSENIKLYNNTYIVDENLQIGTYSFDAYVHDHYGNVTYQKCYVMVVDFNPPTIIGEDLEVSYTMLKEHAELIKQFTVTDNNGDCSIEIIEDNYSINFDKPGTYTVTAEATDLDENTTTATINVVVVDDIAPNFKLHTEKISITTLDDYTEDDIFKHFVAEDEIDGDNIKMWVEDLNGYFLNTKKAGSYNFKIYFEDTSGNKADKGFVLEVIDRDFPSIEIDSTYSIIISSGEKLTKDQVREYFNNLACLTQEVLSVESKYFDDINPEGEYDMHLKMEDGSIIQSKIIVQAQNIDYTPKDNSNFSMVYVGIGIIGLMVIIAGCLAVVRLKKKR